MSSLYEKPNDLVKWRALSSHTTSMSSERSLMRPPLGEG